MNKLILVILIIIASLSNIYAFNTNTDFNKEQYYGENINLGISNISSLEVTKITISIFSNYENYYSNTFEISEVGDIPIVFDDQVYSYSKINYKLLDINDNVVEEKEFDINLIDNQEISDFYLCNQTNCTTAEIPRNYDFWVDEEIYVISDKINNNKFLYNITIETDSEQENQTQLSDENIQFPYLLPSNSIVGYDHYKITLEIIEKQTNKIFLKKINFNLSEMTEKENREIVTKNMSSETEEIIVPSEDHNQIISDNQTQKEPEKKKTNYILIIVIAVVAMVIVLLLISNKSGANRRLSRKQKNE
jgi:hypothetical protein